MAKAPEIVYRDTFGPEGVAQIPLRADGSPSQESDNWNPVKEEVRALHVENAARLEGAEGVLPYSSRAALVTAIADGFVPDDGKIITAGALAYQGATGATVIADLPGLIPANEITAEHFGAVGNYVNDANPGADDTAAIQAALDYAAGKNAWVWCLNRYRTTATLAMPDRGTGLRGALPERNSNNSIISKGKIAGDFASGPVIYMGHGHCRVQDLDIDATSARENAAVTPTPGAGLVAAGILIEPTDTPGATLYGFELTNVIVQRQPDDGVAIEGEVTAGYLHRVRTLRNGRHGLTMTNGQLSGRTHTGRVGIIEVVQGLGFDNGGHNIALGHPDAGNFGPYRVGLLNCEYFRGALDATKRYSTHDCWVVMENLDVQRSATAGTTTGNVADHPAWFVAARSASFTECRFISCAGTYIEIGEIAGMETFSVAINRGLAVTTSGTVPVFATISGDPRSVVIDSVVSDATALHSAVPALSTLKTVVDGAVTYHNQSITYVNTEVRTPDAEQLALCVISSGVITPTVERPHSGHWVLRVDTEASAASDNLTGIAATRFKIGDTVTLFQANSGRDVTVVENTGNLRLATSSFAFGSALNNITLIFTGTNFIETSRAIVEV